MNRRWRQFVRERAGRRCEYCGFHEDHLPLWPFHLDHIVAEQHVARETMDNLAWSCHRCNLYKGTNLSSIDPQTAEVVRLFNPRTDQWQEHFTRVGARIVGHTPTGRATVRLLRMNTRERVDLRAALIASRQF